MKLTDTDRKIVNTLAQKWISGSEGDNLTGPEYVYLAGMRAMAERCVQLCDKIEENAITWMVAHSDGLGDAYQQGSGFADGAHACRAKIRALLVGP